MCLFCVPIFLALSVVGYKLVEESQMLFTNEALANPIRHELVCFGCRVMVAFRVLQVGCFDSPDCVAPGSVVFMHFLYWVTAN